MCKLKKMSNAKPTEGKDGEQVCISCPNPALSNERFGGAVSLECSCLIVQTPPDTCRHALALLELRDLQASADGLSLAVGRGGRPSGQQSGQA